MDHGTLDGLSIGGYVKKGDYEETEAGRTIRKWTRLMEISPVVFPADLDARINLDSVKSGDDGFDQELAECETDRDFEWLLRDAGLCKARASAIIVRARQVYGGQAAPPPAGIDAKTASMVLERLQRMAP
jgi:hypothetical protein